LLQKPLKILFLSLRIFTLRTKLFALFLSNRHVFGTTAHREDDALRGAAYGVCDADRGGQHHPRHIAWHFSPDYISDALAGHSLRNALPSVSRASTLNVVAPLGT